MGSWRVLYYRSSLLLPCTSRTAWRRRSFNQFTASCSFVKHLIKRQFSKDTSAERCSGRGMLLNCRGGKASQTDMPFKSGFNSWNKAFAKPLLRCCIWCVALAKVYKPEAGIAFLRQMEGSFVAFCELVWRDCRCPASKKYFQVVS